MRATVKKCNKECTKINDSRINGEAHHTMF